MKKAKAIIIVFITVLVCCSYSIGQSPSWNSAPRPGIQGIINDGASVYPVGDVSNAKAYPDVIKTGASISRLEFICNLISSCGIYPYGKNDNGDGAIANLGEVTSGATISGIDSSVVRIVNMAKAKS
jgi:hypothetical protein